MKTKITLTSSTTFDKDTILDNKAIRSKSYESLSSMGPIIKNLVDNEQQMLDAIRSTFSGLKPLSFTFEEKF